MKVKLPFSGSNPGVLICGAHGMGNIGDEGALSAILADIRSIDPSLPITVLSRSPEETAKKHGVKAIHSFNILGFCRAARHSALYINGGGSLIQDVTSTRSLLYYLLSLRLTKKRGCAVMMYGCGIGPVRGERNRRRCRKFINRYVDAISLREKSSLEELRALDITKPEIILACDPAISTPDAPKGAVEALMERYGIHKDGKYICFCLRDWEGFQEKAVIFGRAADYALARHGLKPLFFALNYNEDSEAAQLAASYTKDTAAIIAEPMDAELAAGLISRMSALVSMRLHALVFAAARSVPAAGVGYDPKVAAFLEYIGQQNFESLDSLSEERLLRMVDLAAAGDAAAIGGDIDKLRSAEGLSQEMARKLLGK